MAGEGRGEERWIWGGGNRQGRSEAKLVFGRKKQIMASIMFVHINMPSIYIKVYEVYGIMVFKEKLMKLLGISLCSFYCYIYRPVLNQKLAFMVGFINRFLLFTPILMIKITSILITLLTLNSFTSIASWCLNWLLLAMGTRGMLYVGFTGCLWAMTSDMISPL